ncbi:MAG: hypothetical protein IT388_08120 [Nitrospirales bacterium]|nr:hypothetical protein [Nitrospirales bacterium]
MRVLRGDAGPAGFRRTTGNKINCRDFERAVQLLKAEGFGKRELSARLLYGLPGQEWKEVEEDIGFLRSLGVSIHLTEFFPSGVPACGMNW